MTEKENRPKVADVVLTCLADIIDHPLEAIRPTDRIVEDLRAGGDDLSFIFIPCVESALQVRVPVTAWTSVFTVQDAIDLLNGALAQGTDTEP